MSNRPIKTQLTRECIQDLKTQMGFDITYTLEKTLVNELKKEGYRQRLKEIKSAIYKRDIRGIGLIGCVGHSGSVGIPGMRLFHYNIIRIKNKIVRCRNIEG